MHCVTETTSKSHLALKPTLQRQFAGLFSLFEGSWFQNSCYMSSFPLHSSGLQLLRANSLHYSSIHFTTVWCSMHKNTLWRYLMASMLLAGAALLVLLLPSTLEQQRNQQAQAFLLKTGQQLEDALVPFLEEGKVADAGEVAAFLQRFLWQERVLYAAVSDAAGNVVAHSFGMTVPLGMADFMIQNINALPQVRRIAFSPNKPALHATLPLAQSTGLFLHVGSSAPRDLLFPQGILWSIWVLIGCALLVTLPNRKPAPQPVPVKQSPPPNGKPGATPPRS